MENDNTKEENGNFIGTFPEYFERYNVPPAQAREEEIVVYRACKTCKLEKASFLSTYEEREGIFESDSDKEDPSFFSMSVYEKPRDVKRFAVMNSSFRPPYTIAKGKTLAVYGKVLRTKEYKKAYKKSSHVDWWLYEDAEPHRSFELIEDFLDYLSKI